MPLPDFINTDDADFSLGESVNLLLASIAHEEFALANLINAEAEKIQYILGTSERHAPPATLNQILEVNRSADQTLRDIIKKEILLQLKLEKVLDVPLEEAEAADSNSRPEDSAADAASSPSSAYVSGWVAGTEFGTGCAQYTTFHPGDICKVINLNQACRKSPVGFVRIVRRQADLLVTISADDPYFIDQVYLYVGLVPPETDVPEDFTYRSVVTDSDDFFTAHTFVVSESPEQTYYISAFARLVTIPPKQAAADFLG